MLCSSRLHLEERDEGAHLLLHGLEPDQRVELGLELVHRTGRLRLAQRVELVGDPVGAAVSPADAKAFGEDA